MNFNDFTILTHCEYSGTTTDFIGTKIYQQQKLSYKCVCYIINMHNIPIYWCIFDNFWCKSTRFRFFSRFLGGPERTAVFLE